jgi:hypothetical protein
MLCRYNIERQILLLLLVLRKIKNALNALNVLKALSEIFKELNNCFKKKPSIICTSV